MSKIRIDYENYLPPGIDAQKEKSGFAVGIVMATTWACTLFFLTYGNACSNMRAYEDHNIPQVYEYFKPFEEMVGLPMLGYVMLIAAMLIRMWRYYQFFSQDAKSLYTMRRLPQKGELFRRTVPLPLFWAACGLATAAAAGLLFLAIYYYGTPDRWLEAGGLS